MLPISGLIILTIASIISIKADLTKRPTFGHIEDDYQRKDVCKVITKNIDEKLERIEKGVDKILFKNGIK